MTYEVLYYPNFEPNQRWLRSVLFFVDEIQRIIPSDVKHSDSGQTQELCDWLPNAVKTIVPTDDDKNVDEFNYVRLEKAFSEIKKKAKGPKSRKYVFEFHDNQTLPMHGDVWLSESKLTHAVRDLLLKYDLAFDFSYENFIPANKKAADLVVSFVADKIAKRTGLDSVTDCEIPHVLHSLDAIGASRSSFDRENEGLLVTAAALFTIPANVERLDIQKFIELRESYADVRTPFHNVIRCLADMAGLTRQQSATACEQRLEKAIREYQGEFEKYRKTKFAGRIDAWFPFTIQSLLTLLPDEMKVFAFGAMISVEAMRQHVAVNQQPVEHKSTFRMLCKLNKKIKQLDIAADLI